ncbi:Mobile element protein [Pseudomonas chlororaphis]|uniref:Mobile element protein n=1 Tax=Pseudomonas chlororaphis TaxID=587753 RepID=A0A3G7TW40_9PSED|nr:Mobile element protein [Pseudomonas chlororaphis]
MTNSKDKTIEILGQERRRRWSVEEKLAMVRESLEPGQSVSVVARRNGINPTNCSTGASSTRTAACRRSVQVKRKCLLPSWPTLRLQLFSDTGAAMTGSTHWVNTELSIKARNRASLIVMRSNRPKACNAGKAPTISISAIDFVSLSVSVDSQARAFTRKAPTVPLRTFIPWVCIESCTHGWMSP